MSIVRPEEDNDLMGSPGFNLSEKWQLALLSLYQSDEKCVEFLESLALVTDVSKNFQIFLVEKVMAAPTAMPCTKKENATGTLGNMDFLH
jgi:hypothetical protein